VRGQGERPTRMAAVCTWRCCCRCRRGRRLQPDGEREDGGCLTARERMKIEKEI
jgi:hypothetical protein